MAKKGFNFGDTQVAKTAEDIRTENRMPAPETAAAEMTATAPAAAPQRKTAPSLAAKAAAAEPAEDMKTKKTDIGITIQLPREYHRILHEIRYETGVSVRDIALRAVMEFADNYKFEK